MKRFTADVVQMLAREADRAAAATGGSTRYGGLQVGGDIGHGTRYIASHREIVWRGRGAARRAAAYYLGLIDAYRGTAYLGLRWDGRMPGAAELPEVRELLAEYWGSGAVREAYGDGLDYANGERLVRRVSLRKRL